MKAAFQKTSEVGDTTLYVVDDTDDPTSVRAVGVAEYWAVIERNRLWYSYESRMWMGIGDGNWALAQAARLRFAPDDLFADQAREEPTFADSFPADCFDHEEYQHED